MEFPHDKYQRNLKYKKLLGIKRKSDNISDNFVFRSILSDKLKDEYEEVAQNYKNVYSFNWDDSTIVRDKLHPCNNFFNFSD